MDRSAAKKGEGKPPAANLSLPLNEESGDQTSLRIESKSTPKEAAVDVYAVPPRMQAIFVFRLAPAPAGAATAAPLAQPSAAGGAPSAAKEKK